MFKIRLTLDAFRLDGVAALDYRRRMGMKEDSLLVLDHAMSQGYWSATFDVGEGFARLHFMPNQAMAQERIRHDELLPGELTDGPANSACLGFMTQQRAEALFLHAMYVREFERVQQENKQLRARVSNLNDEVERMKEEPALADVHSGRVTEAMHEAAKLTLGDEFARPGTTAHAYHALVNFLGECRKECVDHEMDMVPSLEALMHYAIQSVNAVVENTIPT